MSWFPDPEALAINAFKLSWQGLNFYAFPPFSIIIRVLQKIISDKITGIVVVPLWKTQPWFLLFTSLLTKEPLIIDPDFNLLLSNDRSHHPLWRQLSLVAGHLFYKDFQDKDSLVLQLK